MREPTVWRRLRRAFRPDPREEFEAELEHHIEERIREFVARGMEQGEARGAVTERLGDLERVREECVQLLDANRRAGERRYRLAVSWLDVRLGLRMLVKHPGLTLVGGLGMAVAVAIGSITFGIITSMLNTSLPLDEGDRVVALDLWDLEAGDNVAIPLHEFVDWRSELTTVEDVGGYRRGLRNLIGSDGRVESFRVTEMTAAGFRIARVPAQLGRTLVDEDERVGEASVVVIGHDVWRNRFAGDPGVLGRTVRLGGEVHTIVGVMPSGFSFPENDRFWVPLRLVASDYERGASPSVETFARLRDGIALTTAQAELTTIGQRLAKAYPAEYGHVEPRIMPYTQAFVDLEVRDPSSAGWVLGLLQFAISLLLVVVATNVAILTYARTVTRFGEMTVRSALGASRSRIIGQLCVESLVLSALAAAAGLGLAALALRQVNAFLVDSFGDQIPFWFDFQLTAGVVAYACALVAIAALITGVVPALKATRWQLRSGLQQLSGASAGIRLGRTWTALIVVQVAIAVGAMPVAMAVVWNAVREGGADPGFGAPEFMSATLQLDRDTPRRDEAVGYEEAFVARYGTLHTELQRRLAAGDAADVTFTATLPGDEPADRIEFEDAVRQGAGNDATGFRVGVGRVDVAWFDVLGVPVVRGRGLEPGDVASAVAPIVVNEAFAGQVAGGAGVIGRRIRYARPADSAAGPGRWHEIVGVVADFPARVDPDQVAARIYHPLGPDGFLPIRLAVRMHDADVMATAARVRSIAAEIDPGLRLDRVMALSAINRDEKRFNRLFALAFVAVTLSVLVLSAAGMHALMAFTVRRRRREIGIRAALGADPGRVLRGILARAFGQLAIGIAIGLVLSAAFFRAAGGELLSREAAILLFLVSVLMMAVGLVAAAGPAREGLRIEPVESLREI